MKKIFRAILKGGKKEGGSKKQKNSRNPPINRNNTSDSSQSPQESNIANTPSSSQITSQIQQPKINESNISNNNVNQQHPTEYNLNNDTDEKIVTSSFISSNQSNLHRDYMDSFDSLHSRNSYGLPAINTEYNTVSSISSSTSHLSLEDALFSYISNDSRSEISSYSGESPKIAVQQGYGNEQSGATTTARIIDSLFDRDYQVGNYHDQAATNDATKQGDFFDTVSEYEDLPTHTSQWEQYFVKLYLSASKAASESGNGYARAFLIFEFISNKGGVHYEKLTDRAKKLVTFAQYRVGTMLYEAISDQYDTQDLGLRYLHEARKNGNYHATYYLGSVAYRLGDLDNAYNYLYDAANKGGYLPAMVSFGHYVLFQNSRNDLKNEAMRLLLTAADLKHPFALLSLAVYWDTREEPEKALPFCANLNISRSSPIYHISCYCVSIIYFKMQQFPKAFEYMELSAQAGYPKAKRKLGIFLLNGIGVKVSHKNHVHVFNLIEEAARDGDPIAEIILGQFYMEGLGCEIDLHKAFEIFNRRDHIAARFSRAKLLADRNPEYALSDLKTIIQRTDPSHGELSELDTCWDAKNIRNEARLLMALFTLKGTGGRAQRPKEAILELHHLADVENYVVAQYNLAIIYSDSVTQDGIIIQEKQDLKSIEYFLKGAMGGNPECQYQIGSMLRKGIQIADYKKENAFDFFELAAEQQHVLAQATLGTYYYKGIPPAPIDLLRAFNLFNSAAKKGDETATIYLADFLIKHGTSGGVDTRTVFESLLGSAMKNKKDAYRMLGLVCMHGYDLMDHFESQLTLEKKNQEVFKLYNKAKSEVSVQHNVNFRFALNCFWKGIELEDRLSGEQICKYIRRMSEADLIHTNDCFEKIENAASPRMILTHGQFLNAAGERYMAMKKFQEIAKGFPANNNTGRKARLEICRLVLNENIGRSRLKYDAFMYLKEIVEASTTKSELSEPLLLLGKACDQEICPQYDCKSQNAIIYYERGLEYSSTDELLQIHARMKLVKFYFENMDNRMLEHLRILENTNALSEQAIGQIRYYRGVCTLHDKSNPNRRIEAMRYLKESADMGFTLAKLELGYAHSIVSGEEVDAHECFDEVERSSSAGISLLHRKPENDILLRKDEKQSEKDVNTMKLAAAITYGYHNLVRQAINWLEEIPNDPLARILFLYFKMNFKKHRNSDNAETLRELISPYEQKLSTDLEYCESMMLALCNLRLGQCVEEKIIDDGNPDISLDFYNKSETFDSDNRLLFERLLPFMRNILSRTKFKVFLNRAIKKDKQNSSFELELAQMYHNDPEAGAKNYELEVQHLAKAAALGNIEANYLYGLRLIERPDGKGMKSKTAAKHFQFAANKNYGPAYVELSKMNIKAGFFEDAIEDLEEAHFLNVADASYHLGEYYFNGLFGVVDEKLVYKISTSYSDSIRYYEKAVELNHPKALVKLGYFYEQAIGVNRDLEKARRMYQKAIANDCPDGIGEYALGCWIETVLDSEKDIGSNISGKYTRENAFAQFEKSREAGNQDAKYKVACYLISGKISGHADGEKKGLKLLKEQSDAGINKAILELAKYYESRNNQTEAKSYWIRAANAEDPDALEYLELCYKEGRLGFEINNDASLKYKNKALKARKSILEKQCSKTGFDSDMSDKINKSR